ncbi:hypothetical protein [Parafrankia discariae]|uniref:hypothetical protein n=1 Tax=Parafrankia discariae TaxID=365528 RepID=UPI00037CC60C|nr:hypothetical protein [Parafrankia discariae]
MADLPKVYVAPFGAWPHGDIIGGLITEDGTVLWGHVSSSAEWLRADLTTSFENRRDTLDQRYPDGYEVVTVDHWRQLPAHLVTALDPPAAKETDGA